MGEAIEKIEKFLSKVPDIVALRTLIHNRVIKTTFVYTPIGRVRRIVEAFNRNTHAKAKRKAFNTFAQTGASDFQKATLIALDQRIPQHSRLSFTVFDSFLIASESEEHKPELDRILRDTLKYNVAGKEFKFRFKSGIGVSWKKQK